MADNATTPTPAGASAGLTEDAVERLLTKALKPLTEKIGTLETGHTALQNAMKQVPTAESIKATVGEQIGALQASQAKSAARGKFLTDKMNDLPETYRNLMPDTDDATKLAEAEQQIRTRYKTEVLDKVSGGAGGNASAAATITSGGGGTPRVSPTIDVSKLSPLQKLQMGLEKRAVTGGAAAK